MPLVNGYIWSTCILNFSKYGCVSISSVLMLPFLHDLHYYDVIHTILPYVWDEVLCVLMESSRFSCRLI